MNRRQLFTAAFGLAASPGVAQALLPPDPARPASVNGVPSGAIIYPQTPAELVTPSSLQYPPYTVLRYLSAAQISDVLAGTLGQDVSAAIVTAQSVSKILTFQAGQYLVASNLTLSSKIAPLPGAVLWVNAGVTLTINAAVIANSGQIFISGPGTVVFGHEASSDGWRPEWFGGKPSQVIPTGSITGGTPTLTVSSALGLEFGAGIAVFGAGAVPAVPTRLTLVNNSGSGKSYNVQIAAVLSNSGVSAATSIVSIASGTTPNITASWNPVANAVIYLVFLNGNLIGATHGASYSIGTTAVSGALFTHCPTTAPAVSAGGWLTSIIKGISGTTVTLNDRAIGTATAQAVRLDATVGLQTCLNAADAAYGFGQLVPGTLGARTTAILLGSGIYNLTSTLIAKGMFSILGQGGNWIYGSVILKNQIYANAFVVQGSSHDAISVGCTFDKWQMCEANVAYRFTPAASDYYMRFLGWNGSAAIQSNSIYFLSGMRCNCINGIWTSHGDDWVIEGTVDGGVNFFHQQLDANVPTTTQFTNAQIRTNCYQPQQCAFYLSSANGVTFSGGRYNNVVSPGGASTGSSTSAIIQLAPAGGTAVNNIAIVGNSFMFTRTVLNAGKSSGVTFTGNSIGGLAGAGMVLNGVSDYTINNNTWNFQPGRTENIIAFNSSGANRSVDISHNVFDMTNTSAQYAITTSNAAVNNSVLTNSKVVKNVVVGPASARSIDWIDLGSEMEVTGTYTFAGSYPTAYAFGTLSAAQAYSSAIIDVRWNSSIKKSGVSVGEETGFSTILVAQAGGTSAAAVSSVGTPTAVRMEYNGDPVGASPTTTYTVSMPSSAPANTPGSLNLSVTCTAAGGAMARPTTVSTTLLISTRGLGSSQGIGTLALKLS